MARNKDNVILEDAQIRFLNFAGREGQYNREGDRNFCVLLNDPLADQMARDGWNIKTLKAREDEPERPYIQVSVGYKGRPPRIVMITSRGRTDLGEKEVELLDWVDIKHVDLIIRPYEWVVGGKGGIKAYLKSLFLTIDEDFLELKYSDVPQAVDWNNTIDGEVIEERRAIES